MPLLRAVHVASALLLAPAASGGAGFASPDPGVVAGHEAGRITALVGGTLIDGYGGPPIRDSVILIEGEKIRAVGTAGTLAIPGGAEVISTEGMSVLPGLWDMHVHLMINGHADYAHWDRAYPDRFRDVIMPASAKQLLLAGVTSARDLGAPLDDSIAVRDAINRGTIPGPLFWTPTIEGLFNYEYVRDWPEMLDDPAWHEGLPQDIIEDIGRSIRHPDRLPYFQITPQRRPTLRRKFEQLRESGVTLLVGTDSGIPMKFHSRSTWNELDIWVRELGVRPIDAIRAATYWPAVLMKVEDRVGTVSEGKDADIIAVRGDVLRYIDLLQRVDLVVKRGQRYR